MIKQPAVEIAQLSKDYQESGQRHVVFKDLTLSVTAGEFIVLLGRSGSGKSTLLNLISGIDQPLSGKISVNSINLCAFPNTNVPCLDVIISSMHSRHTI